jgi:small neutral amino acid transporter SnatA (MarC family)
VLVLSPRIVAALGVTGQKILGKLMGLITAVIGVQFAINGASAVMKDILTSVKGG